MPPRVSWIAFTLAAALAQTFRNAVQSALVPSLGRMGATQVRFVFGAPFGLAILAGVGLILPLRMPGAATFAWCALAGLTQAVATLFMLSAMARRDFAVGTAFIKTEPVTVALVSLVALGERPSAATLSAIALATAGVLAMAPAPAGSDAAARRDAVRAAFEGILAGALFAASAVGFRAAIIALGDVPRLVGASEVLALGLVLQATALGLWLAAFDREALIGPMRDPARPALAGLLGALASAFWFLGFASATATQVRTLALVEAPLALALSRRVSGKPLRRGAVVGSAMIMAAALILVAG